MNKSTSEERYLRKYLKSLIQCVERAVDALDKEMKKPPSHERGGRIAQITNYLEFNKDAVKMFGLNSSNVKNGKVKL